MSTRFSSNTPRRLSIENLSPRLLLAADWQNAARPLDVNQDEFVAPIDVLLIINELNSRIISDRNGRLPTNDVENAPLIDTNGDYFVTPIDALIVINALNSEVPQVWWTVGKHPS